MTGYDDLSPRVRWFLENFSELDLAEMCANHEKPADPDTHHYLSTGCLHGEHAYCQGKTGQAGPKMPAQCKFCAAKCQCDCHAKTTAHRPWTVTVPADYLADPPINLADHLPGYTAMLAEEDPEHAAELRAWAQREDAACRQTRKQDMAGCVGAAHTTTKEPRP